MENKKSSSKKKLISVQEEKLIREVVYDSLPNTSRLPQTLLLEIHQKRINSKQSAQKVLVSIKPRAPSIETLYKVEKRPLHYKTRSDKSGSKLATGDHSSFTTNFSEYDLDSINSVACDHIYLKNRAKSEIVTERTSTSTLVTESSTALSKCSNTETSSQATIFTTKQLAEEKCYIFTQPQITMTLPKAEKIHENSKTLKKDIGTLIISKTSSDETVLSPKNILDINKRIDQLERKVLRQEIVYRSLKPNIPNLSSDEKNYKENIMSVPSSHRAGCSYIEYSHIPETSAFQRNSQQPLPLSASKATTIRKEHNSEQYGREFTLYDGITARGRRQCASVPCKRDDGSKMAAERVHKIRHKLNPVRDYRLMDTVHYLAQGEFAPRDDGIKLTPSREGVLSDIIYEDVCRTHWPNTRLARRVPQSDRYGTTSDLQHLIDSLLRERVAHVQRRKRRHYRIVKLNHRHENCRPVGKTGDIIVASHKNRQDNEDVTANSHAIAGTAIASQRQNNRNFCKIHRSYEHLELPDSRPSPHFTQEDCSPGPSNATEHSTSTRESTCCYRTSSQSKPIRKYAPEPVRREKYTQHFQSGISVTKGKNSSKNPRLLVKRNSSWKKYCNTDEPNLEHYILLPTLVVKTPSNMKRQNKFGELYHRILNVQLNKGYTCVKENADNQTVDGNRSKKDIGLNTNLTLWNSEDALNI